MRSIIVMALLMSTLAASSPAHADEPASTRVSLGTDALPWALRGYSVIVGVEPGFCTFCRAQIEVWGFDFPAFFVDLNPDNADEGWRRRADVGTSALLDYQSEAGWHLGALLGAFRSTLQRAGRSGTMWSFEVLARAGFRFIPFSDLGLYIDPWFALGPLWAITTPPTLAGETFSEMNVQLLATVHLGWRL